MGLALSEAGARVWPRCHSNQPLALELLPSPTKGPPQAPSGLLLVLCSRCSNEHTTASTRGQQQDTEVSSTLSRLLTSHLAWSHLSTMGGSLGKAWKGFETLPL